MELDSHDTPASMKWSQTFGSNDLLSWKHCSHKPMFHCILVEVLLLTTKILLAASMTPFQSAPFTVTVPKWMSSFCNDNVTLNTVTYYINTNAIPGELLQENMISSNVKITRYLM